VSRQLSEDIRTLRRVTEYPALDQERRLAQISTATRHAGWMRVPARSSPIGASLRTARPPLPAVALHKRAAEASASPGAADLPGAGEIHMRCALFHG